MRTTRQLRSPTQWVPTQDDLDNNRITYTHDGSESTSDSFTFTVVDGAGGTIGNTTFSITVNGLNDAPVLAVNAGLTLSEGATETMANTVLWVTDTDNTATQLTYTVGTAPAHGLLKKNGTQVSSGGTFTQDDLDNNRVTYTHDESETTSDHFIFTVADGAGGTIGNTTFSITVNGLNDAPVLAVNAGLTLNEGATATIANTVLRVADGDNTAAQLTYTVGTAPTHGLLKKNGTQVSSGGTFTQDDLDNNRVTYAHDESETTSDHFIFTVADGAGGTIGTTTFHITIGSTNDAPVLVTNAGLTLSEGASATMANTVLRVTDTDNTATQITYSVGSVPSNGTLKKSGTALSSGSTFAQDDLDNNRITYTHNGSETTSDSFTFTVADGAGGTIGTTTFHITINNANDDPVLAIHAGLTLNEGTTATLVNTVLRVTDADNTAAQITYTVGAHAG